MIKANKYFENVLVSLGMRQVLGTPTLKSLSWLLNDIQFGGRKDGARAQRKSSLGSSPAPRDGCFGWKLMHRQGKGPDLRSQTISMGRGPSGAQRHTPSGHLRSA